MNWLMELEGIKEMSLYWTMSCKQATWFPKVWVFGERYQGYCLVLPYLIKYEWCHINSRMLDDHPMTCEVSLPKIPPVLSSAGFGSVILPYVWSCHWRQVPCLNFGFWLHVPNSVLSLMKREKSRTRSSWVFGCVGKILVPWRSENRLHPLSWTFMMILSFEDSRTFCHKESSLYSFM